VARTIGTIEQISSDVIGIRNRDLLDCAASFKETSMSKRRMKSQSYLTTDSQWASLSWCQVPIRARDHFFFLLEIFFRQLRVCYFVAPSLTRGWVCNLLLLLVLASAVPLEFESRGTQDHILLSQFLRLPQPGGQGPRIYIPQEQGGPVLPPGMGFPFRRLLRLAGLQWMYLSRLHTRDQDECKLASITYQSTNE
jgi:hypothetical protein